MRNNRQIQLSYRLVLGFVLLGLPAFVQADDKLPAVPVTPAKKVKPQSAQEKAFSERMENTVLVGYFTIDSESSEKPAKPERYEIKKVSKASEKSWIFQTRVKYGSVDVVLPIVVPIEWAGDTPIVSMTDFTIPGLGTFTCRVMFHKDRYAGTWQHGDKGGHMWGKIEKEKNVTSKE